MKFKEFDWEKIAVQLGGRLKKATSIEVEIYISGMIMRLVEVRGEVMIYQLKPIEWSVPYAVDGLNSETLGTWISRAWQREPIDYTIEVSATETEEDPDETS